jgi:hypothetical protein
VLNCSFETLANTALDQAIAAAARAGVFIVFAAGNSGGPNEEASRGDVISVAATDDTDRIAGYSNLAPFIDVAAPGSDIRSTALVRDVVGPDIVIRPTYGRLSGTSFAAPMVSGAVALFESRRRALGGPALDATNVALRLWDTADPIASLNPGITGYGGGRLNLERLLLDPQVSRAHRAGARSVGPSIVVHERSRTRLVWAANNRALVMADAVSGETLSVNTLPGALGRQLAAADLGGGRGAGVFAGTSNGRMCGYDLHGAPLPGWPFNAGSGFIQFTAGPALGDLDGDGVLEVACGSVDGSVWAWSADGTPLAGFPVATSALGFAGAIAIADVDGETGEEIVAASRDGQLHALRFDGGEASGFPAAIPGAAPAVSPVIAMLGDSAAIVVAGGTQIHAFARNGALRWSAALGGTVVQDPALADFETDGSHEIVVATAGPATLTALDATGAVLAARGWPAVLSATPAGAPVAGPVAAGHAGGILMMSGSALVALSDSAKFLPGFPKSGGAGVAPSIDDTDGDGRTEVASGTGPDSLYYLYDAGAASWPGSAGAWPTPRGDYARRGNAVGRLVLPVMDLTPPSAIADLAIDSLNAGSATLVWSAPGGDGLLGRAARYEVNLTTVASEAGLFRPGATRLDAMTPDIAGAAQRYQVSGLAPGTLVFASVRAVDSTGNAGPASNLAGLMAPLGPPRLERTPALAPLFQPSVRMVRWAWRAESAGSAGPREIRLYDVQGRALRTLPIEAGDAGVTEWNGRDDAGRIVPAGIIFARLISGSFHAQSRVVLLP